MPITTSIFGKMPTGESVEQFTLTNDNNITAKIINYGATITNLIVPDKDGNLSDIVLGFDTLEDYLKSTFYFGCIVGRCSNRITGSSFKIGNTTYALDANQYPNHLHGGNKGFDKRLWNASISGENKVIFELDSPDGDGGYPGDLHVTVSYELTSDSIIIDYTAISNKDTIINLTNHSYFNLSGHDSGKIYNHSISLNASSFTETSEDGMPTDQIIKIQNTPMNFTQSTKIGDVINSNYPRLIRDMGYDVNFVLNDVDGNLNKVATVTDSASGRVMEAFTTEPCMQFYTANFLNTSTQVIGKDNAPYNKHYALRLEAQKYPNAINNQYFEQVLFEKGEVYTQTTEYKFSVV